MLLNTYLFKKRKEEEKKAWGGPKAKERARGRTGKRRKEKRHKFDLINRGSLPRLDNERKCQLSETSWGVLVCYDSSLYSYDELCGLAEFIKQNEDFPITPCMVSFFARSLLAFPLGNYWIQARQLSGDPFTAFGNWTPFGFADVLLFFVA